MKKVILVVLSLSLIFGAFPYNNVYSEKSFAKDLEVITLKTKKMFSITHDYNNFDSGVNSYDDSIRYYMNWNDNSKEIPDISVEMDASENLISYYKNFKTTEKTKTSISMKEAEKLALNFIKEKGGKDLKEINKVEVTNNDPWNNFYSFEFYRLVEGIPFYGNRINIDVDKYKKEIISYNANWDYNMDFPDKEKAIEIEKAKEILKDKIGLELIYKVKNTGYSRIVKDPDFYLSYGFLEENRAVEAITGEIIIVNQYGLYDGGLGGTGDKEKSVSEDLAPKEREEIEKLAGIKDIKEVEKISRKILEIDDEYKFVNSNLHSGWKNKDEFLWNLYFEKQGENFQSANIVLNAKTMEIISFYKNEDYESYRDKKPIINSDEALKIAQEYLKKIAPEKFGQLEYMENSFAYDEKNLNFNFIRKEKDIYIEDDYINVGVNTVNKSIYSYELNWYNGKIPTKGKIISKEKAYEILFEEIAYELIYVKNHDDNNMESTRQNKFQIKLIYDIPPNRPVNIEARNGTLLNISGGEYIPLKAIKYKDLDKSYAKDKIKTLGEYGIGFDGENFNPKKEILQKDFLYLLWIGMNPYREKTRDMDKIYEDLINRDIVKEDEKAANKSMAKEQAAVFIIRAMNYEEVANLKGIYKNIFQDSKDIKEEYLGHINLAYGFKIIQGDKAYPLRINPKEKLTREDGASIIYNYIFR